MQVIPVAAIPAQSFNVVLDGQNCTIFLYWKQMRLFMDLICNGNVVGTGLICENRADVLQRRTLNFSGTLHFFDMDGNRHPEWAELDTRYFLIFVPASEELPESLRY